MLIINKNTAVIFFLVLNITSILSVSSKKESGAKKSDKLPPCRACKVFVESFKRGMEKTEKGKFEGGDTAWEEQKLGSYATSEIRLVEIQEKVCSDVTEGQDQCYTLHDEYDSEIEEWWFKKQNEQSDLYQHFCIDTFKHCCPDLHHGPECTPCEGFPDNVCSSNGKCKGSGTRKGNGQCNCDKGYDGAKCDQCSDTHFEAYRDERKVLCSQCHTACLGLCTRAGPEGCSSCKQGWIMGDMGCLDVNECAAPQAPCNPNQFCVNNDGSFKCLECDKSCKGCSGDGPDMCVACATGFIFKDNMCIDSEQESRKQHVFFTRYLTYLGLCIATCIIFNKNTVVAALIGFAVAVYISVSEYVLNAPPAMKTDDLAQKILHQTQ